MSEPRTQNRPQSSARYLAAVVGWLLCAALFCGCGATPAPPITRTPPPIPKAIAPKLQSARAATRIASAAVVLPPVPQLELQWDNPPGVRYVVVERKTDLAAPWETLATVEYTNRFPISPAAAPAVYRVGYPQRFESPDRQWFDGWSGRWRTD